MRNPSKPCGALGVAVLLAGCAHPPQTPEERVLGPLTVAATEETAPAAVVLLGESTLKYAAVEGEGDLTITNDHPSEGGAWTLVRRANLAGGKVDERIVTMLQTGDGSVAVAQEVNKLEEVLVVFEPPLVIVPATLRGGQPHLQEVHMTVHPLEDLKKVKAEGKVKQEIRYDGRQAVKDGKKELPAIKLTSTFNADLGTTKVVNETQQWLVEKLGIAMERRAERTKLLGVQIRFNKEWWTVGKGEMGKR